MSDEYGNGGVPEREDERDDVVDEVELPVWAEVVFVLDGPLGGGIARFGASVAPGVGGDDVVSEGGEGKDNVAPGEGELWEVVQKEDEGRVAGSGF